METSGIATIPILLGRPVAFTYGCPQIKAEFEAICSIYDFCNTDSLFAIPRPLAYYDPGGLALNLFYPSGHLITRHAVSGQRMIIVSGQILGIGGGGVIL